MLQVTIDLLKYGKCDWGTKFFILFLINLKLKKLFLINLKLKEEETNLP